MLSNKQIILIKNHIICNYALSKHIVFINYHDICLIDVILPFDSVFTEANLKLTASLIRLFSSVFILISLSFLSTCTYYSYIFWYFLLRFFSP